MYGSKGGRVGVGNRIFTVKKFLTFILENSQKCASDPLANLYILNIPWIPPIDLSWKIFWIRAFIFDTDLRQWLWNNKYKKSSDLWWRVWGWWSGSCSRSPPHSVCKGCTAHWTDGEWFLHTLCKQRMTATTVHCFISIINKNLWIFFSSELAVLTSFSLLLFQNYPPRNKQAGRMWLDILGHMLQQGQRSFSLGRQLGNTRNHQ